MKGKIGTPHQAVMGWIEPGGTRKDAVEYARGYATKHMDAPETCWFEVLPFLGGFLWEVQELGPGLSYLPATAKSLSDPLAKGWFRVRKRVFQVQIMDGKPHLILLPETASRGIIESGKAEMRPSGRMRPVVRKGTRVLVFGATVFASGTLFLTLSYTFAFLTQTYAPEARRLDQDLLPHRAWAKVERVPPNLYVESMRFKDQAWTTNIKPVLRNSQGQNSQQNRQGGTVNTGTPVPSASAAPPKPPASPPQAMPPQAIPPQAAPPPPPMPAPLPGSGPSQAKP